MKSFTVTLSFSIPESVINFCLVHNLNIDTFCSFLISLDFSDHISDNFSKFKTYFDSSTVFSNLVLSSFSINKE